MDLKFKIKTAIMKWMMEKKRKAEPFDGKAADSFQLPANAGPMINNSYFFGANDPTGHSLIMRVGYRNTGFAEVFVIYTNKQKNLFFTSEKESYPIAECPMKVEILEPEKRLRVMFDGNLKNESTGEIVPCKYDLEFTATLPIFSAFHHSDFRGMAQAFARAKWNKEFFKEAGGDTGMSSDDKKIAKQIHYEQAGHFAGEMTIGGKNIWIDMPGSRDHAYGKRDWDYMSDHIWIMVTTAKGETFNFSMVNYPKVEKVFCGYTNIGYDHDESLIGYKVIQWDACDGKAPDVFIVDCKFTDGKWYRVTCKREYNLYLQFGGGVFFFQEGVGEVDINGIKARGSIEYGFNRNKNRWVGP